VTTTAGELHVLQSAGGVHVTYRRWLPDGPPRATVQVVHGASEHSGRYERLAAALTGRGLVVHAMDLRGHGRTAEGTGTGRFGEPGVDGVLDDVRALQLVAADQRPRLPRLLGSLAAAEQIAGLADRELLPADLAELHLPARV